MWNLEAKKYAETKTNTSKISSKEYKPIKIEIKADEQNKQADRFLEESENKINDWKDKIPEELSSLPEYLKQTDSYKAYDLLYKKWLIRDKLLSYDEAKLEYNWAFSLTDKDIIFKIFYENNTSSMLAIGITWDIETDKILFRSIIDNIIIKWLWLTWISIAKESDWSNKYVIFNENDWFDALPILYISAKNYKDLHDKILREIISKDSKILKYFLKRYNKK